MIDSSQMQATNKILQKILIAVQGVEDVLVQKQRKEEDVDEVKCTT